MLGILAYDSHALVHQLCDLKAVDARIARHIQLKSVALAISRAFPLLSALT